MYLKLNNILIGDNAYKISLRVHVLMKCLFSV